MKHEIVVHVTLMCNADVVEPSETIEKFMNLIPGSLGKYGAVLDARIVGGQLSDDEEHIKSNSSDVQKALKLIK